jgi:hypothetical protein
LLVCSICVFRDREDTEDLLRRFLHHELEINYRIEFGNVHRFKTRSGDNRRPPIVARFVYHSDLRFVLNNANKLRERHLRSSTLPFNDLISSDSTTGCITGWTTGFSSSFVILLSKCMIFSIDTRVQRMETNIEKRIDDLNQSMLSVSSRVRTLENRPNDDMKQPNVLF